MNTGGVMASGCSPTHVIQWTSSPIYKIPEGTRCLCGRAVVKYKKCECCGNIKMVFEEDGNEPSKLLHSRSSKASG